MQKLKRQNQEVKRPSRNSSVTIRRSVDQHCSIETMDADNNNNNSCIDNTHRTSSRNISSRNTSNREQNRLSFQENSTINNNYSLTEEENNMSSFDKTCFTLLDAISRDEPCTLHFTFLFRMWCKLLSASHHWPMIITYVMSGLFELFLVILIALIGCHASRLSTLTRSSQLALIILFTIFAFVLLMAMLHFTIALFTHNTYTDVVARFFRKRTYNLASLQTQVSEHSLSIPELEESVELSEEEQVFGVARESESLLVSPEEEEQEEEQKELSERKKNKHDSINHKKSKKEYRHKKHKDNMLKEYEQSNSQRNYDYLKPDKLEEINDWKRKSVHANGDVDDHHQNDERKLNKASPTHSAPHNAQSKQLRIANGNKEEQEEEQENATHKKRLDKENISTDKHVSDDDKAKTKNADRKHHHKLLEIPPPPPSSSLSRKKENEEETTSHSSCNSESISNYSNGSSYSYSYSHSHSHSSSSSSSLSGSSSTFSSLLKAIPSRSSSLKRSKQPSLQTQENEVHNVENVISGNTENKEKKINNKVNNGVIIQNNEKRRRSSSHQSAGRVNMDVPERPERRESNVFMQKPIKIPHPPMLPENNANNGNNNNNNNKMLDKEQRIKLDTSTSAALPLAEFLTSSFQSHNKLGPLQDHERMD